MAKKLIISIDGGGIRGVIPLVHLREIQLMLQRNLEEYDVEWWGTSTGAVIAAGLSVQQDQLFIHRIQSVLDLYEFRSDSAANPFGASNPARAFNLLIDHNFSAFDFRNFPYLHVVACRVDTISPFVFCSENNANLAEAVRASCAVPGIFPSVTIGDLEFVDGFVIAKNPAGLAVAGRELNSNVVLLSLGCGVLREQDDIEKQVFDTHAALLELSEATGMHYFRFDPVLKFAQDQMQNTNPKNIFNLKKDAMEYIFRYHEFCAIMDQE